MKVRNLDPERYIIDSPRGSHLLVKTDEIVNLINTLEQGVIDRLLSKIKYSHPESFLRKLDTQNLTVDHALQIMRGYPIFK